MADQTEYVSDVKTYASDVDEAAVKKIVNHLGIALRSRDSSLVACSDKSERDRVRDSFLKKKLGLTQPDAELDAAVQAVCKDMGAAKEKSRVTFYYLLAAKYDKLSSLS